MQLQGPILDYVLLKVEENGKKSYTLIKTRFINDVGIEENFDDRDIPPNHFVHSMFTYLNYFEFLNGWQTNTLP